MRQRTSSVLKNQTNESFKFVICVAAPFLDKL